MAARRSAPPVNGKTTARAAALAQSDRGFQARLQSPEKSMRSRGGVTKSAPLRVVVKQLKKAKIDTEDLALNGAEVKRALASITEDVGDRADTSLGTVFHIEPLFSAFDGRISELEVKVGVALKEGARATGLEVEEWPAADVLEMGQAVQESLMAYMPDLFERCMNWCKLAGKRDLGGWVRISQPEAGKARFFVETAERRTDGSFEVKDVDDDE